MKNSKQISLISLMIVFLLTGFFLSGLKISDEGKETQILNTLEAGVSSCVDAWQISEYWFPGAVYDKICISNNRYYCRWAFYDPEHLVGFGICTGPPVK
jgi:hypothetical protein